jgi:hypothetical protein
MFETFVLRTRLIRAGLLPALASAALFVTAAVAQAQFGAPATT